ncbi:META domain-containing protein [Sulfitobacter sp. F26169L]|uniref:META domain-containing protein n=1 Tax=Sulfitobacter sp. F26169L TaxID=2996015 RepID=UPI0022608FA1|nr:META domain-containing protein [Sulfitobacter sp. F26169L]MCX7566776.1 META domain-containing protein [Sulfitobacter sp. F26169L]
MKTFLFAVVLLTALSACKGDETVRAYGGADHVWTLKELGGATFPAKATLTFPKAGEIAGEGPCNRYFGALKTPYPWFDAGPIGSTRVACPEMTAETAFLAALESATLSEVAGDTLVLSNTEGLVMVFKSSD